MSLELIYALGEMVMVEGIFLDVWDVFQHPIFFVLNQPLQTVNLQRLFVFNFFALPYLESTI